MNIVGILTFGLGIKTVVTSSLPYDGILAHTKTCRLVNAREMAKTLCASKTD